MLPTDKRFQDLTTEQLELMYEQFMIDNPPEEGRYKENKVYDSDYDKEESEFKEHYEDPDFDQEWNKLLEEEKKEINDPKKWEEVE